MKKKIIILMLVILAATVQGSYANTDYPQTNNWTYECSATGEGTLTLFFGGVGGKSSNAGQKHHIDKRTYRVDYPGIVTLYNTNRNYAHADILASDGIKTTGCKKACELGPISGNQKIWPDGWSHKVQGWGQTPGNETSPDAYVYTGHWPNWVQARSGAYWVCGGGSCWLVYEAAGFGDTRTYSDGGVVGFGTTEITFIPTGNGMGNCAKCSSGISPTTVYESAVTPACDNGTVVSPTSSTDSTGKTTYSWSCSSGGGTNASCTAQSKPVTDPPACDETRRVSQCMYSMAGGETLSLGTSDGPTTIGINSTAASLPLYVPGACRAPVAGVKPRVVCDGYSVTIETSLTSFTLPSDVTRKPGKCSIIFDDPGYCYPRSKDTIEIKAKPTTPCLTNITLDAKDPNCIVSTNSGRVCVELKDKYGSPVREWANKVSVTLGATQKNTYYSENNSIIYIPGTFTELSAGTYCGPIIGDSCEQLGTCPKTCVELGTCPKTCVELGTCPPPPPVDCTVTGTCPCVAPVNTCTPTILNNYCKPPGPVTTIPGGDIITAKKACRGHIEVWNGTKWTTDGSTILYDQPYDYRIFVDGSDPVCSNGVVSFGVTSVIGGAFSGGVLYSGADTFRATITKTPTSTPTTPRGISVKATFTQPASAGSTSSDNFVDTYFSDTTYTAMCIDNKVQTVSSTSTWTVQDFIGTTTGVSYGLTESDTDFSDTPIQITGDRMKGVRVIGNTAGTNIGEFNLNNGWVVAEQGPITNAARSTMLQKVALLTRGITPNTVVNGILYIEGDINYSSSIIKSSVFNTLIVRGNLTIDENIGSTTNTDGKGIIILANSTGNGGNIIIGDGVRIIHALIFAEGTLRGVSTLASQLNQSIQLVIKGSLFSRNTIGGSAVSTALYLAGGSKTDDVHAAFIQDLNNVRNGIEYNPDGSPLNPYKGYSDPFIIDYDPALRLLGLPGFTN